MWSQNARSLSRLRSTCERAKRTLSSSTVAHVAIDSLFEGIDFNSSITRTRFEEMNMDYFHKCIEPVERVLRDARIAKDKVHEVLLVGGSTRVPKVQQKLSDYFGGKELCKSVNPDEAAAGGASVMAVIFSGNHNYEKLSELLVLDVVPITLGVETPGGVMTAVLKRNTTKPAKKTLSISTTQDNQTALPIRVFEGEKGMIRDCALLGEFILEGIPPMPRGQPKIDVTFDVDAHFELAVTAVETSTGRSQSIQIKDSRFLDEEISRMAAEAGAWVVE